MRAQKLLVSLELLVSHGVLGLEATTCIILVHARLLVPDGFLRVQHTMVIFSDVILGRIKTILVTLHLIPNAFWLFFLHLDLVWVVDCSRACAVRIAKCRGWATELVRGQVIW